LRCTVTVDATYRELAGSDHIPWMNPTGAEEIAVEIQDFLYGTREEPEPDRILATVLFTDIADSTATMARIGDIRWRQLREVHHETVRRELERFEVARSIPPVTASSPPSTVRHARSVAASPSPMRSKT
jgi:class 3 adenylate cyclase